MTRILVTGGSGFIGTNLVERLLAQGHDVLSLDTRPPHVATHRILWKQVDLLDRPALMHAVGAFQPAFIYHLAARTDMHGRDVAAYAANTAGVANLIEAARGVGDLRRVVFASSRLVCEIGYRPRSPVDYRPTTPYGESKVIGEKLVREARGLRYEWVLVRPTSIWGPWFHVPYRNFFDAIRHGRYVHPRGHRIRKSFGYVGNAVHQLERLMGAPAGLARGNLFYLADYAPIEVLDWGERIRKAFGASPIREVPLALMSAVARAGDVAAAVGWKNPPLTSFRLSNLLTEMLHDTGDLETACGPLPHSLDEGIANTVSWMVPTSGGASG